MSNEAQQQDLVSISDAADLPALPADMATNDLKQVSSSQYVFFAHPRADKYGELCVKLQNPKLAEGSQILVQAGDNYVHLSPMRFMLVDKYVSQYWARLDARNTVLEASKSEVRAWREHIDAIILVFTKSGVEPARCTFRGPKATGARKLHAEIRQASLPGWDSKSAEHAHAAKLPQAWTRVVGTIALSEPIKPKGDDPSKTPYTVADAVCKPISLAEYEALKKVWGDVEFKAKLAACAADLTARLNDVKGKIKG